MAAMAEMVMQILGSPKKISEPMLNIISLRNVVVKFAKNLVNNDILNTEYTHIFFADVGQSSKHKHQTST